MLEKMGVVNGLDGLDFSLSTFLMDQRTINVVLVYEIDVKGFGIFDQKLIVKQTASTAAWLGDTEGVKLSDVASKTSAWQKSDMERGKDYVSELQGENPHQGVKNGVGVDLYDQDSNTFTAVHSMNVFAASYSDYVRSGDGTKASDYILKREKIKAALKAYANALNRAVDSISESIEMSDGTDCQTALEKTMHREKVLIIVVPEEATEFASLLQEIANEIEQETGVKVNITYRDKALGG